MLRRAVISLTVLFLLTVALAAEPADAFPVTLKQWVGDVTVSAPPERIVTLGPSDLDAALALGFTPVAALGYSYSESGIAPWLEDRLDTGQTMLAPATDEVSLEWVVAQRPDLILATGFWNVEEIYEQLSQIAPTVAGAKGSVADTWEEQVVLIGQALGKSAEADDIVEETKGKIETVRQRFPQMAGKTFSLSYMYSTSEIATIYKRSDAAVQFFQELGLQVTPQLTALENAETATQGSGIIGLERLDLIEADMMVIAYGAPEYQAKLEASPLFNGLATVKAGHYAALDLTTVAELRIPTVLGLVWATERLEPILQKTFGDP